MVYATKCFIDMIRNLDMNTHLIIQADEEPDCHQSECKVIPLHDEDMTDVMDESMGLGFDRDLLKLFYFVPVALLIAVICPMLYIAFYWTRFRNNLSDLFRSFWSKFK